MTDRKDYHTELVSRVKFLDPKTSLDDAMMKLCLKLLQTFRPESNPSPDVVINLMQECQPPAKAFSLEQYAFGYHPGVAVFVTPVGTVLDDLQSTFWNSFDKDWELCKHGWI